MTSIRSFPSIKPGEVLRCGCAQPNPPEENVHSATDPAQCAKMASRNGWVVVCVCRYEPVDEQWQALKRGAPIDQAPLAQV